MNTPIAYSDAELIAYYWQDGLDAARSADIAAALAQSAALQARYAGLVRELELLATAWPAQAQPQPDASFEARLWQRIDAHLGENDATPRIATSAARTWAHRRRFAAPAMPWRWAMAATLLLALGAGYLLGRHDAPREPALAQLSDDGAQRLLAAYLIGHLDRAEQTFLIAANSPEQDDTAQRLAAELLQSHRLYAQAAARAGKPQLAAFLRDIEPVLRELAMPDGAGAQAARARIEQDDLTFKTRAAARLTRRELAPLATRT
jgi:hypothetical protein